MVHLDQGIRLGNLQFAKPIPNGLRREQPAHLFKIRSDHSHSFGVGGEYPGLPEDILAAQQADAGEFVPDLVSDIFRAQCQLIPHPWMASASEGA